MHEFTLFNKMSHGRPAQFFSMSVLALGLCTTFIGTAHAEQYCKSIDRNGSVSYTLAPETGCNKKKFKTVSVSHNLTSTNPVPVKPEASPNTPVTNSNVAPTPTPTPTPTHPVPLKELPQPKRT